MSTREVVCKNAPPGRLADPLLATPDSGNYDLALVVTAATFTVTATAKDGRRQDENCLEFSINQTGTRTAEDEGGTANTAACWR